METPQGGVAAFAVGSFGIRSEGEAAAEDRPHPCGVGRCFVHGGRGIAEAKPQPPGGVAAFAVGGVPFYSFSSF